MGRRRLLQAVWWWTWHDAVCCDVCLSGVPGRLRLPELRRGHVQPRARYHPPTGSWLPACPQTQVALISSWRCPALMWCSCGVADDSGEWLLRRQWARDDVSCGTSIPLISAPPASSSTDPPPASVTYCVGECAAPSIPPLGHSARQ